MFGASTELEGLVQRTLDELQLDLPARYAELDQQGGYQPADMDWDAVAQEIKDLREKIQRLGNVNLDSLTEQEELEQRIAPSQSHFPPGQFPSGNPAHAPGRS